MKLKSPVNLHKGTTFLVVGLLMLYFQNLSISALLYLALHGSYGLMWLLKNRWFPDKQWEAPISIRYAIIVFTSLGLYWVAPVILITSKLDPPPFILFLAVMFFSWGVFLHFGSDAQKYFTMKYRPGLITEGFFKSNRNANYLGELLIYRHLPYFHTTGFPS